MKCRMFIACVRFLVVCRKSVFNRCVDRASSRGFNGSEASHEQEEDAVHEIDEERCYRDILMASHCHRISMLSMNIC